MKEISNELKSVALFKGIKPEDIESLLDCVNAKIIEVNKGDFVLSAGDKAEHVGIVLRGSLHIVNYDADGERTLIAELTPGEIFADALCCACVAESPVSIMANANAKLVLIEFHRVLHTCPQSCPFHKKMVENMVQVLASNYLQLLVRIGFLSKKSIRDRIISYLEHVAAKQGNDFSIPFNRSELADFLCIDRSALSRELGRLKEEGVIDYWKNRFRLL